MTLRELDHLTRGARKFYKSDKEKSGSSRPNPWAGMKPGTFQDYQERKRQRGW